MLEAKKQFALAGKGDLEDYGITEDDWEATDWTETGLKELI